MKTKPKKETRGRPAEGRVRLVVYVSPQCLAAIMRGVSGQGDTAGKSIERKFGIK